jgi:hypothetical protein
MMLVKGRLHTFSDEGVSYLQRNNEPKSSVNINILRALLHA